MKRKLAPSAAATIWAGIILAVSCYIVFYS